MWRRGAHLGRLSVFLKYSRGPGSLEGHDLHGPMDSEARHILARLAVGCPVIALHQHVSPGIYDFERMLCIRAETIYGEQGRPGEIMISERKFMKASTYLWDPR